MKSKHIYTSHLPFFNGDRTLKLQHLDKDAETAWRVVHFAVHYDTLPYSGLFQYLTIWEIGNTAPGKFFGRAPVRNIIIN